MPNSAPRPPTGARAPTRSARPTRSPPPPPPPPCGDRRRQADHHRRTRHGSGMIAPDMATMLGFIFTDLRGGAGVSPGAAECRHCWCRTRSPSTASIDIGYGARVRDRRSGRHCRTAEPRIPRRGRVRRSPRGRLRATRASGPRDGEGATKFISVSASAGAEDDRAAKVIALSIANSAVGQDSHRR